MALSYRDKYERSRPSYVKVNDKRFADLPAGTTVLVPSPRDIEAEIRGLRGIETLTFAELRERLAARHAADGTCPVMTSMNLRIVAEIALAELDDGRPIDAVTEVWRVIDPQSALAGKLPGGPYRIGALRTGMGRDVHGDRPTTVVVERLGDDLALGSPVSHAGYLRTRNRRIVTASDRVLSSGSRSILAKSEEE